MFSSWPVSAFVAGVKIGSGSWSASRRPAGSADPADRPGLLVLGPAGAGEVPARHALERDDLALADDDGAAGEHRGVGLQLLGKARDVRLDQVVVDVRELPEPEVRELRQDLALVRDAGGEDAVERRDPVARDEEERGAEIVELADLAAAGQAGAGQVGFGDGRHEAGKLSTR